MNNKESKKKPLRLTACFLCVNDNGNVSGLFQDTISQNLLTRLQKKM